MKWLRLYHDTINDPKWRLVALDSGQPLSAVLAVWMSMLINASQSAERGTLEGWDDRVAGAAIDLRADAVRCIREAMQGLTLDGFRLTGWEKRQRASDDIAGRVQRHRNKAKDDDPGGGSGNGLDQHRNDTPHKGNGTVTLQNADVTLHQASVTENPLRAQIQTKTSEKAEEEDDAGAPEAVLQQVTERVAAMAGISGKPALERNAPIAAEWLAFGADPDADIYPAVANAMNRTPQSRIRGFAYFTDEIKTQHRVRITPKQEVSNVRHIRHAGEGKKQSGGSLISRIALGLA